MLTLDLRTTSAILLIFASTLNLVSNLMFTARSMLKWYAETETNLRWERGLLVTAFVLAAMAVSLLGVLLNQAGDAVLSRLGVTAFLIGAVIAVVVEAATLSRGASSQASLEVIMVVVLFAAGAILGASLVVSGLLPAWAGWAVVTWNVVVLAAVTIFSSGDMYYPAAHFLPLVFVGIMLLVTR